MLEYKKICEYELDGVKMIVIRTENGNVHSMQKSELAWWKDKYKYGHRPKKEIHNKGGKWYKRA